MTVICSRAFVRHYPFIKGLCRGIQYLEDYFFNMYIWLIQMYHIAKRNGMYYLRVNLSFLTFLITCPF
jgi:hypothetical protein